VVGLRPDTLSSLRQVSCQESKNHDIHSGDAGDRSLPCSPVLRWNGSVGKVALRRQPDKEVLARFLGLLTKVISWGYGGMTQQNPLIS
jgi:hypothetical protein